MTQAAKSYHFYKAHQNFASFVKTLSIICFRSLHVPHSTFSMANVRSVSRFCIAKSRFTEGCQTLSIPLLRSVVPSLEGDSLEIRRQSRSASAASSFPEIGIYSSETRGCVLSIISGVLGKVQSGG